MPRPPVSSIIDRWRLRKKKPKTFWCCWKQAGRQQYIASLLLVLSECKIAFQKSFLPPDIVWNKTWLFSKVLRRERHGSPTGLWRSICRLKVKAPTIVARNNGDESSSQVRFRVRKFRRTPPNTMLWNACRSIHLCWWWLKNIVQVGQFVNDSFLALFWGAPGINIVHSGKSFFQKTTFIGVKY